MPRLLFGLESIFLLKKHFKLLNDFHVDTLRKLQTLPSRTSYAAVLLLLGALPMEAELDKRHLSLLFLCLKSDNTKFVLLNTSETFIPRNVGAPSGWRIRRSKEVKKERQCLKQIQGLPDKTSNSAC